jgi:hypothetical protein
MSMTGISSTSDAYTSVASTTATEKNTTVNNTTDTEKESTSTSTASSTTTDDTAVVYDKTKLSEDDRKTIIEQLKADQEKRQSQLTSLVSQMLNKQANTYGTATNMWQFLASGNFTVDADTQAQAQKDIAEDGYWGVNQTSDRIVQFATSLAGDDTESLQKMRDAFLKGYEQAEKTWGGELPDISKKTYDAVLEKLDKLINPSDSSSSTNSSSTSSTASTTNKNTVTSTEDGTVVEVK